MTESRITKEEYINIINSIIKIENSTTFTIDLLNQNISDIKLYQSIVYYTKTHKLPEHLKLIRKLYLDDNQFTYGYRLLFNILKLSNITFLSLHNNKLDDAGTIILATYLCNSHSSHPSHPSHPRHPSNPNNTYLSHLKYLDISKNLIGYEGAQAIAEALKTHKCLIELDMNDNNIGSEGANYIGEMLKLNTSIELLNLNDNNIKIYESNIFAEGISINKSLYFLDIGYNQFNEPNFIYENIEDIFKLIFSSKAIKYLIYDFSDIDDIIMQYIANELKTNNILLELSLRCAEISNEGAYLLFDALKNNKNSVLKTITLSTTLIDNECLSSLAELLGENEVLQTIDMYDTEINNKGLLELSKRKELKYNDSIVVLTFGQEDIEEEDPICNTDITNLLNRNINLFWKPYIHKFKLFNKELHLMIMSTLLCNTYGQLKVRLPMEVIMYIFKFFNRANFLNY
jgi:Ran GTPase-activating protein (RanGAP) involved in mRNA processing and transport